ncbi:minichromosome maintenance-related protein, variant 2 [Mucor circinelloides]
MIDTVLIIYNRRRIISSSKCKTGLQNVEFVPIQNVENRTKLYFSIHVGVKPSKDWGTIGVVDRCISLSDFCVTRITDMRGSFSNLYITGKAFSNNQDQIGMGSIIAIKRPFLLKPTETHHSIGLHVDQVQQMWVIGQSLDLAQCGSFVRKDVRCTEWTDIRSGDYCDKHLERVCNYSKNGRMELAGGNSGFDIRWATQKRQSDGTILYESKREKRVDPMSRLFSNTPKSSKDKEAYYLKGKGLVAVDGTLVKKTAPPKREPTAAEKEELTYY